MRDVLWLNPAALLYGVALLLKAKRPPTKAAQIARAAHAKKLARQEAQAGGGGSTSSETDAAGKKLPNRDRIGEFTSGAGGGGGGATDDGADPNAKPKAFAGYKKPKKGDPDYVDHDGKFIKDKAGNISYKNNPKAKYNPLHIERHELDRGMDWCPRPFRLAIYHRDGLACAWCGNRGEDGHTLTLDHLTDDKRGGTDEAKNLVTTCLTCNSTRKDLGVNEWAAKVAAWKDTDVQTVLSHIHKHVSTPITREDEDAAREHMAKHAKAGRGWKASYRIHPDHTDVTKNRAAHHADLTVPDKW